MQITQGYICRKPPTNSSITNCYKAGMADTTTLRMGELEPWMDETFIKNVFSTVSGETVNVKVIRDRASGYAESFLFQNRIMRR